VPTVHSFKRQAPSDSWDRRTDLLSVKFVPLQTFNLVSVLWQSACLLVQTASLRYEQNGRKLEEKVDKVKFRAELAVSQSHHLTSNGEVTYNETAECSKYIINQLVARQGSIKRKKEEENGQTECSGIRKRS